MLVAYGSKHGATAEIARRIGDPLRADGPDPSDRWQDPNKVRELGEQLRARDQVVFGGRLPSHPRNFMERAMLKNVPEDKRDRRDFGVIGAWAHGIADQLPR